MIKKLLLGLTFIFSSLLTIAQAPANDLCEDAIVVSCGDVVTGNTDMSTNATSPEDGCGTANGAAGNWYSLAGNGDIIDLSLCSLPDYDTKIRVYSGNCFSLACVGGNDDSCGLRSEFTFVSDASTNYLIYVFGFGGGTGDYELTITCTTPPPAPVNDECLTALPLVVNADETCTLLNQTLTIGGATSSNEANPCPGTANDDVWYSFVATAASQIIEITNVQGAPTNLVHSVYQGTCGALVNIACSDPDQSLVQNLTIGDTYFMRIYSFGTTPFVTTTFDLCIRQLPLPPINDECDDAIVAGVNADDTCVITTPGTLAGATDSNLVNPCPGIADDDVWFEFVAMSEVQIIELLNITGSPTNLVHALYEGDCTTLVNIGCSDADQSFAQGLVVGQTYFIRVFTFGTDPVNDVTFDLCIRNGSIDIVCASGPYNDTFCYENGSTIQQIFQGDTAFPLRLIINSGMVENGFDEFIVLDSDGVTNLNPDDPYGDNGDLAGLVFTATGNSISFQVQSDGSISCGSGSQDPIDYTVICLECTEPVVTFEIMGMCEPTQSFNVEVTVADVGSGGGVTITDDAGGAPQMLTNPGIVVMGPYDPAVDVVTITVNPGDPNCTLMSEPFAFLCIVDGCYTILDAGEDVFLNCEIACVDLMANFIVEPGLDTTEYLIQGPLCDVPPLEGGTPTNIVVDDTWSQVIDLPFDFNYYTNDYGQLVVGPNGQISFNTALAGGFNGWNSEPGDLLPVTDGNFPLNTVYGAFHDLQPATNPDPTRINYFISGVAPYRIFVLNFNEVPHFGCDDLLTSQQILLYESLNVIDVNLINKPTCLTWNDGLATLGLMGNNLTEFSVPEDRNTGPWEAQDETWRFVPNGAQNTASSFTWTDPSGTVISTDPILTVCPTFTTTYTATLTTELPDGTLEVREDDVIVEREEGCITYDCTDTQFSEDFGEGTTPVDHPFLPAPYVFDGGGTLDPLDYSVQNGTSPINTGWHQNLEDHTEDDTNGNALIINVSDLPAEAEFYRREIAVEANTDYFFVIWVTTMYDTDANVCPADGDPTNFIYRFEDTAGVTVSTSSTGDVPNQSEFEWKRFFLEFNSGNNTTLDLVLENIEFGGCGNDFAIDDIGLYFEGTPPEIATPDDLIGCDDDEDGFATYDLTAQNDAILNGLDAVDFNITFHTTDADAMNDENAIVDPAMYTNTSDPEVIWVRVEREDQDSCFSITQFNIEIGPNLDLGITLPALFEICSNEDFPAIDGTVTNAAIDLTMVTYEWKDASGTVVSTDPIFVPTAAGVYTLEVFAPVCGTNVYTTEVTVFDAPVLDLGMDESFCEGDDAFEIVPNITGDTTGITYVWSTGETTPTITVDSTGVYTLTILVDVCTVEATVSVSFLANPIITLGADFQTCPDMDTTLTATVDVEGDLVYEWLDPNGAVIADESGPSIVIQVPAGTIGAALYTVNVLNGNCLGSDTIDISLYNVDNCIISEGVSPNGDGMNDTLDLQFLDDRSGIELFQVFNRLGTAIYEKIDYVNEWGGQTNDGDALPTGTYFYVIQLENDDAVYGREVSGWVYVNRED